MLVAIKNITDDNFFFEEDSAHVHCVCNTMKLSENMIFVFPRFCQVVQKHKLGLFEVSLTRYAGIAFIYPCNFLGKASFDCLLYR